MAQYNTLISAAEVDSLYLSFGCGCRGYGAGMVNVLGVGIGLE